MTLELKFELIKPFPDQIMIPPQPSRKLIPHWFKKMGPYTTGGEKDEFGKKMETVKKCIPFLDAMSAGYTLLTHIDMQITINEQNEIKLIYLDEKHKIDTEYFNPIENHPKPQVKGSPFEDFRILKYLSPWRIKTPPGYSILFLPPMNQFELSYIPICGWVDSDIYEGIVNFPFIMPSLQVGTQINVPAGSPFVQMIPIKRDEWSADINMLTGQSEAIHKAERNRMNSTPENREDFYRDNTWEKKKYR